MGWSCRHRDPNTNNILVTVRVSSLVLRLSRAHLLLVSTVQKWVPLRAYQED